MEDRVPTKPGRVLITPENGSPAYYATVAMADEPTQVGTALNKENLLSDATAALFGLGTDAVPNDILNKIYSEIVNLKAVDAKMVVVGSYVGNNQISNKIELGFQPRFIIVFNSQDQEGDDYGGTTPVLSRWFYVWCGQTSIKINEGDSRVKITTNSTGITLTVVNPGVPDRPDLYAEYIYNSARKYIYIAGGV